jgi:hypothetical protein
MYFRNVFIWYFSCWYFLCKLGPTLVWHRKIYMSYTSGRGSIYFLAVLVVYCVVLPAHFLYDYCKHAHFWDTAPLLLILFVNRILRLILYYLVLCPSPFLMFSMSDQYVTELYFDRGNFYDFTSLGEFLCTYCCYAGSYSMIKITCPFSARVGNSWWNLRKKNIPIWVFFCWNAIWVSQWNKCQTEVSKCYVSEQQSYI